MCCESILLNLRHVQRMSQHCRLSRRPQYRLIHMHSACSIARRGSQGMSQYPRPRPRNEGPNLLQSPHLEASEVTTDHVKEELCFRKRQCQARQVSRGPCFGRMWMLLPADIQFLNLWGNQATHSDPQPHQPLLTQAVGLPGRVLRQVSLQRWWRVRFSFFLSPPLGPCPMSSLRQLSRMTIRVLAPPAPTPICNCRKLPRTKGAQS